MEQITSPRHKFKQAHDWFVSSRIAVIICLLLYFTWIPGLYGLWKGKHFKIPVRWLITVLVLLRLAYNLAPVQTENADAGYQPGTCAATITEGNCTYYRDDNCNVIGRLCE